MGQPVRSWIDDHAARTPGREAVVDLATGRRLTYAQLSLRVRALAVALRERGVERGTRVAVLSRNDFRTFEVLYACAHVGAICVLLNWRLSPDELTAIVTDADPLVLLAESWSARTADQLAETTGIAVRVTWASEADEHDDYEPLTEARDGAVERFPEVDEDDPWTIIYTSGTTGLPKGVLATHRNVLASITGIALAGEVGPQSRCLTVLPTFHVAGLALFAHPVLLLGGTVVVMRQFDPARALALLTDTTEPLTHFCGVPANFQFMERLDAFRDADFRGVVAAVGGAPVPTALIESWTGHHASMVTVYGITEAGATVIAVPAARAVDKNGTIGLPLLHAACRIRAENGRAADPGEVGELQIRGALVTPGYWRNPEATRTAIGEDGWFGTGDLAVRSADGYFTVVDRRKDMYISGGENVYPAEVENILHAHPQVSQAAVIGVPDDRWGEVGLAYVVPAGTQAPAPAELADWCATRLARYKVPARFHLTEELPRNATGKILKTELRRLAATS
ncbi:AMP-binding protein [Amycolatopsis carbonis]|uniref:AMP-binding protein n=1 Tax=Amycolatopsis carbonis TaxID=715471 RepID=A0A9Y2MP10_9PSEU|nr:AMP-binding protein [Amycolatopsis sp. 2-15]WIX75460.1 AMP-binding protein [Amycolatopsis sp. 2-15]